MGWWGTQRGRTWVSPGKSPVLIKPRTVYIAGPFTRQAEFKDLRFRFAMNGVVVTSGWLDQDPAHNCPEGWALYADGFARCDFADIDDAETFLVDTTTMTATGGMHVELGYAYAKGKEIFRIGPPINIFHHLRNIKRFGSWQELFSLWRLRWEV